MPLNDAPFCRRWPGRQRADAGSERAHAPVAGLVAEVWSRGLSLVSHAVQVVLNSPGVGASMMKAVYVAMSYAACHPKEAAAALLASLSASAAAAVAHLRAALATSSGAAAAWSRAGAAKALDLMSQLQGLLVAAQALLTHSPRQAGCLAYSVLMALVTAQGR